MAQGGRIEVREKNEPWAGGEIPRAAQDDRGGGSTAAEQWLVLRKAKREKTSRITKRTGMIG